MCKYAQASFWVYVCICMQCGEENITDLGLRWKDINYPQTLFVPTPKWQYSKNTWGFAFWFKIQRFYRNIEACSGRDSERNSTSLWEIKYNKEKRKYKKSYSQTSAHTLHSIPMYMYITVSMYFWLVWILTSLHIHSLPVSIHPA